MYRDQAIKKDIKQCLDLIVAGSGTEVTESWTKLRNLENDSEFVQFKNHEDILREILNSGVLNPEEMPEVFCWFSKYLHDKPFDVNPISNDIAVMLKNAYITDMTQLTAILQSLLEQKVYLPGTVNHAKLCEAIVTNLSCFTMPCDPKKIQEFNDNATKVQYFLEVLRSTVKTGDSDNLIFVCLQTLYKIISDSKDIQDPGPGLAIVLQLVEPAVIPQAVNLMLSESYCDVQLTQALKVLCSWLPKWKGDRLSIWVMEFIYGLERQQKYSILMDVTKSTLKEMFYALLPPFIRQNTSQIVYHVLKRQGSPALINNVLENLHNTLPFLTQEDSESSRDCIQNIVNIMYAIKMRFPRNLTYDTIKNKFPLTPQLHIVLDIYSEPVWVDEAKEIVETVNDATVVEPELERPQICKVGLTNLGNTCYMNSLLQALFMTKQLCYEVLMCKPSSKPNEQLVLKELQKLFTLLQFSKRISLAPTEFLMTSRPSYFLPGQQQDSSEFLCHLLDALHEQERSAGGNCTNDGTINLPNKAEMEESNELCTDEKEGMIKRWTTEEDLTGGNVLQRKTQSLADFTLGEDLAQTQQLSDSHSDSTDSGIQSVGGEEPNTQTSLVHRVLGGKSKITYQCAQCDNSSHNTDKFLDLQLCFPEEIQEHQEVSVQDLINYYLTPEKLTGENKYRCDKCTKLCDAQRIIKILQAPAHLILILKHFRYDFDSRLRTKLRHKVLYNETIQLPVSASSCTTGETYQLYAAVVHSGYSMDYGHYFTYACVSKQNWFKFNDSYVSQTTFDDFKELKAPDTPYILFYEKCGMSDAIYDDKLELSTMSKELQELVANDTTCYIGELRHQTDKSRRERQSPMFLRKNENSDDENPPPSSCRGTLKLATNRFLY